VNIFHIKISKYLTLEVLKIFFGILIVLSLLIFGNQIYLVLSKGISEGYFASEFFPMIAYKFFRDASFIVSLSFSLAIIYALSSLYKSSELIVTSNAGIGDLKLFKMLFPLISLISIFVLFLSAYISPEALKKANYLKENAKSRPEYIFFKEGIFQNFNKTKTVFYASEIKSENQIQLLDGVFIYSELDGKVILSKKGYKHIDSISGRIYLSLSNGKIYQNVFFEPKKQISISYFDKLKILMYDPVENVEKTFINSYDFLTLTELFMDLGKESKREILYRLSVFISLLVISILSIQFSRINPRKKRNFALGYGLLTYIAYYNSLVFIKELRLNDLSEFVVLLLSIHLAFIILFLIIHLYRSNFFYKN